MVSLLRVPSAILYRSVYRLGMLVDELDLCKGSHVHTSGGKPETKYALFVLHASMPTAGSWSLQHGRPKAGMFRSFSKDLGKLHPPT